ncbi:hypothetical protein EHF33_11040 [Deinococcus psychrotolerans]|uniref:Uncharacterized protein n=1 Tax=Deinococcus psychrotolerans TaxID=2489213 RepID=A0A3G8YCT5_9DEIO|nr:hypothetical protein [Deinococcus psychrotolerans]AZI43209.1 hypothetical protein EHF33_11040 [Deinococcus psychrotolerans]
MLRRYFYLACVALTDNKRSSELHVSGIVGYSIEAIDCLFNDVTLKMADTPLLRKFCECILLDLTRLPSLEEQEEKVELYTSLAGGIEFMSKSKSDAIQMYHTLARVIYHS